MSEIEKLICEFSDLYGQSKTDLAQAELDDLRRFVQVGIEILEARDKGLSVATDALIDKSLRRLIYEHKP